MKQGNLDKKTVTYFVLAALLVLAILKFDVLWEFAGRIYKISLPLLLGAVMAYILNIIMRALERIYFPHSDKKLVTATRRPVCIFLSLFSIAFIMYLIFRLVIPELTGTIILMKEWISGTGVKMLQDFLDGYADRIPELKGWIDSLSFDWNSIGQKLIAYFTSGVGGVLGSTLTFVGVVGSGITNFVIGLIFAIYILANKEKLAHQCKRTAEAYAKPAFLKKAGEILAVADETFSSFIVGQCTEAVILGVLCMTGMLIFRFPYAPMVGAFIGATALIPIVGAYLGAAVGFIMILTVSPVKALLFLVFIIVLQQLEGNLIYPRVVGSTIGLPGIWVLAAVTVGGGLSGIGGMLVGVPAAATLYKLLRRDVNERTGRGTKWKKDIG